MLSTDYLLYSGTQFTISNLFRRISFYSRSEVFALYYLRGRLDTVVINYLVAYSINLIRVLEYEVVSCVA